MLGTGCLVNIMGVSASTFLSARHTVTEFTVIARSGSDVAI